MKYIIETIIDLPLEKTVELFNNEKNLHEWMPGLENTELLEGTAGTVGAKTKMVFQHGKRRMEMIETITVMDLPHHFEGTYDMDGVHNIQKNKFEGIGEMKTRWISTSEFQFKAFFMKMIAFLMPGSFKSQSKKISDSFKAWAEANA